MSSTLILFRIFVLKQIMCLKKPKLEYYICLGGRDGVDAVVLADHGVILGAVGIEEEARKACVWPINGCGCYAADRILGGKAPRRPCWKPTAISESSGSQ
jgi:hypothetical protein